MPNYQNGKIYKLVSASSPDLVYIGSTCQSLSQRLAKHKGDYKRGKGLKTRGDIVKNDDVRIILIENYPCNSKEELVKQEELRRQEFNENGPQRRCHRDPTKIKEIEKEVRIKYVKENPERVKKWSRNNYQRHKEELKEKVRNRYNEKKEIINTVRMIKIKCDVCGFNVAKTNMARHKKSPACKERVENNRKDTTNMTADEKRQYNNEQAKLYYQKKREKALENKLKEIEEEIKGELEIE